MRPAKWVRKFSASIRTAMWLLLNTKQGSFMAGLAVTGERRRRVQSCMRHWAIFDSRPREHGGRPRSRFRSGESDGDLLDPGGSPTRYYIFSLFNNKKTRPRSGRIRSYRAIFSGAGSRRLESLASLGPCRGRRSGETDRAGAGNGLDCMVERRARNTRKGKFA